MVLRHLDLAIRPALRAASTTASRPRLPPFEGIAFAAPPSPSVAGQLAQVYLPDMHRIEHAEPAPVLIVSPVGLLSSGAGVGKGLAGLARLAGCVGVASGGALRDCGTICGCTRCVGRRWRRARNAGTLGTPDSECWATRYRQRGSHGVVRCESVVAVSLGMRSHRRKVAALKWPTLARFVLGQRNLTLILTHADIASYRRSPPSPTRTRRRHSRRASTRSSSRGPSLSRPSRASRPTSAADPAARPPPHSRRPADRPTQTLSLRPPVSPASSRPKEVVPLSVPL